MLPPSSRSPAYLGEYLTDERIFRLLDRFNKGGPLPDGFFSDSVINPYQFNPSNLPEGWYFVHSTERKDTDLGYWRARGEPCEIYKDSVISGWRTTLEFFEGLAPLGRGTKWVMQEYKITQKGANELKGNRTLCRFFPCDGEGPSTEVKTKKKDDDTVARNFSHLVSTVPSAGSTSRRDIRGETLNKESPAAERLPDLDASMLLEMGYIVDDGDFLEMDDLADQDSRVSSSDNSSRISDEAFDSLLRDIEDEIEKDRQKKASISKFSVVASARPDLLVLPLAAVESLATAVGSKSPTEKTAPSSAVKADAGRQNAKQRNDGATSSNHEASSSSSHKEKKVSGSKKKLKNKYLCFMPF